MSDLSESRISEIREDDAEWLIARAGDSERAASDAERQKMHGTASSFREDATRFRAIADRLSAPSDLEALLTEREGMKAEIAGIKKSYDTLAAEYDRTYAQLNAALDKLPDAPLDPSSAPSETPDWLHGARRCTAFSKSWDEQCQLTDGHTGDHASGYGNVDEQGVIPPIVWTDDIYRGEGAC